MRIFTLEALWILTNVFTLGEEQIRHFVYSVTASITSEVHVETTPIYRVLCHFLSSKHDRALVEMTLGVLRNLLVSAS